MYSPRKRTYSKSRNEELMTWVGIGRYEKGEYTKEKLKEPQTLRVGHGWVDVVYK